MELAFVLFFVLLGTGVIVYAGMRKPPGRTGTAGGDTPVIVDNSDTGGASDGDGGGGGD